MKNQAPDKRSGLNFKQNKLNFLLKIQKFRNYQHFKQKLVRFKSFPGGNWDPR